MKINIVSSGYVYNNVRSLLFPLINFRNFFKEKGIELNFLKKINVNCDILFIESNFIGKRYVHDFNNLKYEFKKLGKIVDKLIYFDTSDSTSILHPKLINYVNVYCKGQILKDLNQYKYKYYGNRIFTHFAYKNFGIIDDNISFSEKLDTERLEKIKIHWNSGILNHSLAGKLYSNIYGTLPINKLLNYPKIKTYHKRKKLFFTMTTSYNRNTIAWHRKYALEKIFVKQNFKRLNFFDYYKYLSESEICLSPFGWGEINYRDFEAFTYAALLIKPDMRHLSTWPEFYDSKNFVSYNWACTDLKEKIDNIIKHGDNFKLIANSAQKNYLDFLNSKNLNLQIYQRIIDIINT